MTRSAQLQSGVSRLLPEYRKLFCQRTFASTDSGVDTANSASPGDTAPRNHLSVSKSRKINQISTITPNGHQTRSECCVPGSYPGVTPATRPDTGRLAPCRFHAEHRTGIQHHAIVSASASPAKSTRSVQSLQADNKRDRSAVSPGVTPATRPLHRQRGPTPDGLRCAAFMECIARSLRARVVNPAGDLCYPLVTRTRQRGTGNGGRTFFLRNREKDGANSPAKRV